MPNLPDPIALLGIVLLLGLAPFAAIMVTSYTKLVIVFGLLRSALGVPQVPPNMVLNAIAIILSVYVMAPIGMSANQVLQQSGMLNRSLTTRDLLAVADAVKNPMHEFLMHHTTQHERQFFLKSAQSLWPKAQAAQLSQDDFIVVVPAFTVSEITKAFQIGFVLYMMFVVVDLIVGTVLLMLGMSMISPTTVSVPFKLLLFVSLDGWSRLIHALVLSYRV
ncbi:type III secretion system export apparatus subunit SctR [Herbaspirillum sp. RTI4]|uniref:type III secretion system export apparatus subunit SctR n=1 Tax=Herbaspirillum sp. RTI4 TaxID=3048640 RepID=UPI002AB46382|nr:type III secretion system export apparatus subunit SctR [Herbaspirillum sp. RTI4]MDY7577156.1 type III secretion system export apparatus subunit SctR [Herbaspirillum sp. RTI4]MEA9980446.1 type III secretion system export apparatus subunit SctR [Herbaspirillum sp. RTI4]